MNDRVLTVHPIDQPQTWNAALRVLPYAHVLQTWEWGEFKRQTTGWVPLRLAYRRDGEIVAMVSLGIRRVGPLTVMYAPKGPAMPAADRTVRAFVLDHLQGLAARRRAIWLKIDADVVAATGVIGEDDDRRDQLGHDLMNDLKTRGWVFSNDQVQFRNTIKIDLTQSEDALLAAMSQNTRRKVRIAEREGVVVRHGTQADLPALYELYRVTGARDGFLIRPPAYYELAWRMFMDAGLAQPLIAEVDGRPIAHVILFTFGQTCWYLYGASGNEGRDKMPNYLLQWEAMRWAKARGCLVYDLWGAPDVFDESDPLWGVYRFKQGFRGTVTRHIGAWDYAPTPLLYSAYNRLWPRALAALRRLRLAST